MAVNLLLTEDFDAALALATELVRKNQTRQELESVALGEALGMLDGDPSLSADRVLVLASPRWHPGVIGIVASRLVEHCRKPVLLLACEGDRSRGSARSTNGFDLIPALEYCSGCLLEYGGHAMAAGLSIETAQIDRFRVLINEYADKVMDDEKQPGILELDALVSLRDVTYELVDEIEKLKPYGHGNPSPVLGAPGARLLQYRCVGKNEAHLKIRLGENRTSIDGIGFNLGRYAEELAAGKEVSVAFTPTFNDWQGRRYLQVRVNDLHGETPGEPFQHYVYRDDFFHRAGELVFIPETMLACLRDYLVQNRYPVPEKLSLLQVTGATPVAAGQMQPDPVPCGEPGGYLLTRLEPGEKCILVLVNSTRHTIQLARYFEYHIPEFTGLVSYINGFMPANHINSELHNIISGKVKLLVATYACLTACKTSGPSFGRVVMARPPATGEDWLGITAFQKNAGPAVAIEAGYTPDDWRQDISYLDELAPERDMLACLYAVLRLLASNGTGLCTVDELITRMHRSGCGISTGIMPVVAVAIFRDLGLLQYRWEEGMLKYNLMPVPGRRRDLNESSTFIWTRRIKAKWLDWFKSGAQWERA